MVNVFSVLVIGFGPRGLGVLERLLARAAAHPGALHVHVVDPTCDGTGLHTVDQPDYLLLNTVCGQVTMFPDQAMIGSGANRSGPSLYEWASTRGLRVGADGWSVGQNGRPIQPTDFLPRRVLGEYLRWFRDELLRAAPPSVRVVLHRTEAVGLVDHAGPGLAFRLGDGEVLRADSVFLTVGHTPNGGQAGDGRVVRRLYPLPASLSGITGDQSVAVAGMGLSAMDTIAALTVGRGGRFTRAGDAWQYLASGEEPAIVLYSASGVPFRARPLVNRPVPDYRPVAFTEAAIDALRRDKGGPLDFDADVLPLILTEMRVAYHRRVAAIAGDADPFVGVSAATELTLGLLDATHGEFDPVTAWRNDIGMALASAASYQDWVLDVIRADLAEGVLGFDGSPVKAGVDVLRELRETVRHAVDFGGVTARSLREFLATSVPRMNRAVVGPQHERHRDLVALVDAGVVRLAVGPEPHVRWRPVAGRWRLSSTRLAERAEVDVDWLCPAHVPYPAAATSASALVLSLNRAGLLTPRAGATGAHIDRDHHPLRADGRVEQRIRVLGPLCEGSIFYNHLVPSPGAYCRPVADADRCVAGLFAAHRASPAR